MRVTIALLLILARPAFAGESAVLIPSFVDDVVTGPAVQPVANEKLKKWLSKRGYSIEISPPMLDCGERCLSGILLSHHAVIALEIVARGALPHQIRNDWSVSVRVLRSSESMDHSVDVHCDNCGFGEAVDRALGGLDDLLTKTNSLAAATPNSEPPSLASTASAEPHTYVHVEPPIRRNEPAPLPGPPLNTPPVSPQPTSDRPSLSRGAAKALVAVGVIGLSAGIAMTAVGGFWISENGKQTCSTGPLSGCPTVYTTMGPGLGMLIPGLLLVGGGIGALAAGSHALAHRARLTSIAPMVGPNGGGLVIGGAW